MTLFESSLSSLPLLNRGKVRDIYAVGEDKLLIITSDRMSAFDVVLPDPIPGKGAVLTEVANFWFNHFKDLIPNHLTGIAPEDVVESHEHDQVKGRAIVVNRLSALPVEAVVRGYLIGSGWQDYQKTGSVCGITLPSGLELAQKLPEAIFTPATKAEQGDHDENISYEVMVGLVGETLAKQVKETTLALFEGGMKYAATRNIIIADTKFEFGTDEAGQLHLIDEVLTPDSSRFWPLNQYQVGVSPPSLDKQILRDYLDKEISWNKQAPAPKLPDSVIKKTAEAYKKVLEKLIH